MNFSIRLLAGALFGILYAVIIALGYLTSNGNIAVIVISAFFGIVIIYVFYKFLTEENGEDDTDDETED